MTWQEQNVMEGKPPSSTSPVQPRWGMRLRRMQMEPVAVVTEARDEAVLADVSRAANKDDEGVLTHSVLWIIV